MRFLTIFCPAGDVVLQINGVPERLPEPLQQQVLEQARVGHSGRTPTVTEGAENV